MGLNRQQVCLLLVGSLIALTAGRTMAAPPTAPAPVQWQTDLKKAHELSVASGKPLLIVFGAEWCGYCHKLEQKTLADPRLAGYVNAAFIPVHLDFDQQPKVAEILEVEAIPCSIVLSPEADLLGRIDGFTDVAKYKTQLDDARETYGRIRQVKYTSPR